MHGVKRVLVFCILIVILPATLIIIPLYLRKTVFADVTYPVAESDIIEIRDGISSIFCQQHSLRMNTNFNAFQLQSKPEISTNRKHIRLKKSMTLPDDTLEYWGFFLLKGAKVHLKFCSRYDGSRILVVKGQRDLKTCGLLDHNKNKLGANYAQGHEQVKVFFEDITELAENVPADELMESQGNETKHDNFMEAENHGGEDMSDDDDDDGASELAKALRMSVNNNSSKPTPRPTKLPRKKLKKGSLNSLRHRNSSDIQKTSANAGNSTVPYTIQANSKEESRSGGGLNRQKRFAEVVVLKDETITGERHEAELENEASVSVLAAAENIAPVQYKIPAQDKAPTLDKVSAQDKASSQEKSPTQDKSPAQDKSPSQGKAPAEDNAPAQDKAPLQDKAHAKDNTTAEDKSTSQDKAPPQDKAPLQDKAHAENKAPTEANTPAQDKAPLQDKAPAQDKAPLQDKAPTQDKAPHQDNASAQDMAPPQDKAPPQVKAPPQDKANAEDVSPSKNISHSETSSQNSTTPLPKTEKEIYKQKRKAAKQKVYDQLFKQRTKREQLYDRKYSHGGNAVNFTETDESNSVSSFETGLFDCFNGAILLAEGFPPSAECLNAHFLENGSHRMLSKHEITEDGYYYYIFYSDNDLVRNDIHAIFDIYKPTFQYSNQSDSQGCINATNCTFSIGFLSDEIVVVEVPTRDGIEHEADDITYLISTCHPRTEIYAIFPITVLILILSCSFL